MGFSRKLSLWSTSTLKILSLSAADPTLVDTSSKTVKSSNTKFNSCPILHGSCSKKVGDIRMALIVSIGHDSESSCETYQGWPRCRSSVIICLACSNRKELSLRIENIARSIYLIK